MIFYKHHIFTNIDPIRMIYTSNESQDTFWLACNVNLEIWYEKIGEIEIRKNYSRIFLRIIQGFLSKMGTRMALKMRFSIRNCNFIWMWNLELQIWRTSIGRLPVNRYTRKTACLGTYVTSKFWGSEDKIGK